MGANKKNKIPIRNILLEASFVVLGVILAFSINQCRENRDRDDHAEHAAQSVYNEIRNNRELLTQNMEYHTYLADTLQHYLRHDSLTPPLSVFNKGFIAQVQPLSTAWEAARATEALQFMDYNTVLELSELYQLQEQYEQQAKAIGEQFYGMTMGGGINTILKKSDNLISIIYMFIYREKTLLETYDEFLKVHPKTNPNNG